MKIAYLINQYPRVSHSFIRREIVALETKGLTVERFSVRETGEELFDPADREERKKTRTILAVGWKGLLWMAVKTFVNRPINFLKAFGLTCKIGWNSDRGLLRNFAYLVEACTFLKWVKVSGVHHIHAHFGTNSAAVAMLTSVLGGPSYSFTVHGPEEFDGPKFLSLGEKIKRAKFVVGVSDFGRSQLYRQSS